jgi:copper(I)-binding protein
VPRKVLAMPLKANPLFRTIQAILIVSLLGGAACSSGAPQIVIEEPEAKLSPVILGVASVFMKIVNSGNGDDRLVSARADIPGTLTELHDEEDRKMKTVTGMDIPGNGTLVLKPGGQHLMIFRLPRTMQAGSELTLVLNFKRSGERRALIKLTEYATSAPRTRYH